MNSRYRSRKFIITLLIMGITLALSILGKIESDHTYKLLLAALGVYGGTNVLAKIIDYFNGKTNDPSTH